MKKVSAFFSLIISSSIICLSQTIINGGPVSGVWNKSDSPYIIDSTVTIPDNLTLTIDPGVIIKFNSQKSKLDVKGCLKAKGDKDNKILFTTSDSNPYWQGIKFNFTTVSVDTSILDNCIIENCFATSYNYPNYITDDDFGGGISVHGFGNVFISNSIIRNNRAYEGGGIYCTLGKIILRNTSIINNSSIDAAGAIYLDNSTALVSGCNISGNTAEFSAAVHTWNAAALFINNTICNNISTGSENSSVIHLGQGTRGNRFVNNIIYFNRPNIINIENSYENNIEFSNCDIEHGMEALNDYYPPFNGYINHLLESDPLFINPDTGNYNLGYSPCINAGDTSVINYLDSIDINGNPRIYQEVDKRIDIGAFEYQDTLPNRRPVLIKKRDQRVMKEQIGNFKLYYFDADTNDELSFIVTCKDTGIAVQIVNITDSCLDIQVTPEQSIAVKETYLNVEINDNAGQSNSILYDSVKLIISDQFEGIVNTYVTLSGTVKIIGDIIVEKNGILDILPGTNMQFQGPYKIEVMGKINMKGTPDKRIVFTCADTSTYEKFGQTFKRGWGGIIFNNINTQDTVFADNCIFRNTGMDSVAYVLDGIGTIVIENSKNIYFNNCRFFNNYTYNSDNNSGLYIDNSENIKISGSSFTSCYSLDVLGAYVYATNSEFKISGCRFFDTNIKENEYNKHCIYSTDSKCTIDKSLFYNNYFSYGYVIATVRGQFSISESEIRNNDAGGLNIASDTALILSNKIINNKRAIEIRATPSKIINNIIAYNKLYCNCSNLYGVAIDMFGAEKSIVANNTIVNNFQDSFGNAVYSSYSSPIIVNNIFWGNNREGFGWYNGADIGFEDPVVKNNIDVDPQFQLNDSLDFHLLNSSPCINTGIQDIDGYDIPEFDIEGNYRIDTIYGLIDIGAYEYAGDDVIIDEPVSGTLDNVIQKNNEIKLYPNPTGNFINLSNIRDKSIYKIYTIEGKLVGAGIIEKGKIKVKDLGKGTYYLLLFSDNYIYRNVFIKM